MLLTPLEIYATNTARLDYKWHDCKICGVYYNAYRKPELHVALLPDDVEAVSVLGWDEKHSRVQIFGLWKG